MKKRFSLVEMLVVIAIIAILLTFLLPGLGKARAQARTAQCAAQMHQYGLANQMYLSDNDNYFNPNIYGASWYYDDDIVKTQNPTGSYTFATQVYLDSQYVQKKATFMCPSSPEDGKNAFAGDMSFNTDINKEAKDNKLKSLRIKNASQKIITSDTHSGWLRVSNITRTAVRHQGEKINHLWIDGHTSTLKYTNFLANPQWLTPLTDSASWSGGNSFTFQ